MTAQLGRRGLAPEEEVRVLWELGRGDLVFCSGGPEDLHLSTPRPENRLPARSLGGEGALSRLQVRGQGVPWCTHTQAPVGTVEAGLVP